MDISALIHLAISKGASDLHLITSSPPLLRINGLLQPLTGMSPLTPEDINQAFNQISSERERTDFERNLELDFGYTIPDLGRFRCNVAKQRGTISLVIRLLPLTIPTIDELGLPEVCKDLVYYAPLNDALVKYEKDKSIFHFEHELFKYYKKFVVDADLYHTLGPYPLFSYLIKKELEQKNLFIISKGIDTGILSDKIREMII